MDTKHTPGPWQVNNNDPLQVCDCDGELRGCAPIANMRGKRGEAKANARLIAAAPELFAFAEKVARICNGDEVGNPLALLQAFGDEARAAIAKARGES